MKKLDQFLKMSQHHFQSELVCDSSYESDWIVMNKKLNNKIIIIMMRSKHFCKVTAGGFVDVSLKTFAAVRHESSKS